MRAYSYPGQGIRCNCTAKAAHDTGKSKRQHSARPALQSQYAQRNLPCARCAAQPASEPAPPETARERLAGIQRARQGRRRARDYTHHPAVLGRVKDQRRGLRHGTSVPRTSPRCAPPLAQCALLYDDHWNEHVLKRTVLGGDSGDEGPSSDDDDDDGPDAAVGAEAKGVTRRTSSSTRPSRRSAPTRPLHQPRLSPPLSGPRTR